MAFLITTLLASAIATTPTDRDIHRAVEQVPRPHFKGKDSLADANKVLNQHLKNMAHLQTRPCETFEAKELQQVSALLYSESNPTMLKVYSDAGDNRRQTFGSEDDMNADFSRLNKAIEGRNDLHNVYRDGLCHRAVMWFVHHLPKETQAEFAQLGIDMPLLPISTHTTAKPDKKDAAAQAVHKSYKDSITCQKCHVGGIDSLGVPEVKPVTQKELSRRCYTDYKELFGISCKPCDGVAGAYWGDDDDKYFTADPCEVVGTPLQIPVHERVQATFPNQFSVNVVAGSDRWGRTTNPTTAAKTPFPPVIDSMYGQISGHWYTDITPDSDLWLLRHDTKYEHIAFNGTKAPLISLKVSEIHSQTKKQQSMNVTGPMVSIIDGIPDLIPGGCTCVPDPVGVPDTGALRTKGIDEMQYLGRIKLTLAEHNGEVVELDHWANWFFHVFMDVNKSVPHYGLAPKRLASAYAGTAIYDNWTIGDPKILDPTVWYREIPTRPERVGPDHGDYCMNPTNATDCVNISDTTFPPQPEGAGAEKSTAIPWKTIHRSFLPSFSGVQKGLSKTTLP
jgi:hypothetical protein